MNDEIKKAIEILRSGGIILYPTDTVWGIGCDATNEVSVQNIFKIKEREDKKAMLVLLDRVDKLYSYIDDVPDIAFDLIEFSEKPLTIIYPEAKNLAKNLIGNDNSIGIRITREEFSKKLCEQYKKPIVSTSANISGEKTPLNFNEISDVIKSNVDYVVKYRQNELLLNRTSSIIKLGRGNLIEIIRK